MTHSGQEDGAVKISRSHTPVPTFLYFCRDVSFCFWAAAQGVAHETSTALRRRLRRSRTADPRSRTHGRHWPSTRSCKLMTPLPRATWRFSRSLSFSKWRRACGRNTTAWPAVREAIDQLLCRCGCGCPKNRSLAGTSCPKGQYRLANFLDCDFAVQFNLDKGTNRRYRRPGLRSPYSPGHEAATLGGLVAFWRPSVFSRWARGDLQAT